MPIYRQIFCVKGFPERFVVKVSEVFCGNKCYKQRFACSLVLYCIEWTRTNHVLVIFNKIVEINEKLKLKKR